MLIAAAILAAVVAQNVDAVQCPEYRCEVSGVEAFDGRIVCRRLCSQDGSEDLKAFLLKKVQDLRELYSVSGFLDAQVELVSLPSPETPLLKLKADEGALYWVQGFEIHTDRADYDAEQLRDQLLIHAGDSCKWPLIEVSVRRMQVIGKFRSSDYDILKGPEPGQVNVRITLSGSTD